VSEKLLQEIIDRLERIEQKNVQEFFSVKDTAALVGVEAKHIRRAMEKGELLHSNIGTGKRATYRIARRDIDAWIESKQVKCEASKPARQAIVKVGKVKDYFSDDSR
jgi:excisionase family DNA binding protein